MTPKPTIYPITDFDLKVEGAGGQSIPYIGCIECSIGVPFLDYKEITIPALVVPTTQYGLKVPVIVGTNAIRECKVFCNESSQVPNEWNFAFISMQESSIGVVKSTNKFDIQVQPNETITLSGLIRKKEGMEAAVTEGTEAASSRIGVCPRIVS